MKFKASWIILLCAGGCGVNTTVKDGAPDVVPVDVMAIPDAIPRAEARTRAGNPDTYEVFGKQYRVLNDSKGYRERGIASWYGNKFHGKRTSNGEKYDMFAMTAAHKTLPIPSYVRVTNLENQRSVVLRINDRGPFHDNRVIDLSYTAAVKLGIQQAGTARVEVQSLEPVGEKKKRLKRASPVAIQRGGLYIQIGAFNNPFNARKLQQKIAALHTAKNRLKVVQQQGDTLYKVQLGPIYSIERADHLTAQLQGICVPYCTLVSDQ